MAKSNKRKPIQKIAARKGIALCEQYLFDGLSREAILQELSKICNSSVRTIDGWIALAKPAADARITEAEQIRIKAQEEAQLEAIKKGLRSDLELEVLLCQIAMDEGIKIEDVVNGIAVLRGPTASERIAAIDKIFKKRGSNAPAKVANTDSRGNDITPYTDTQVDKIIKEIRANA